MTARQALEAFEKFAKSIGAKWFPLLFSVLFFASSSFALNSGITYHGRILEPDGTTPVAGVVQFKMQIRTPDSSDCLMYEEWQSIDLTGTNGVFALTINDGSGTRHDSSGYTIDQIFGNRGTFTFAGGSCAGTNAYTPSIGDGRNLKVTFQSSTMTAEEAMPVQSLNFAPLAIEAKQISGVPATSLLRFIKSDGSLVNTSPLNDVEYASLVALVDGTSTLYAKPGDATNGTPIYTTSTGTIGSTTVGDMWLDTSTPGSDVLKINTDSGIKTIGLSSTGFINQVTAGTGISVTTASGNATVGLSAGGVGTTELAAGAVTGTKIATGTITGTNLDAGIVISTTGTVSAAGLSARSLALSNSVTPTPDTISIFAPAGVFTNYSLILPNSAGGLGQVLSTDGAGNLSWVPATAGSLASGNIFVGNASNVATGVPLTGDVSISVAGLSKVVGLQGVAVATTTPLDGQVLVYSNSATKWQPQNFSIGSLKTTTGATQFAQANCLASQTLTWSSLTDTFTCANISVDASAIASGTIDPARLPASASDWANNGTAIYNTNAGLVGIGTSSPSQLLTLETADSSPAIQIQNDSSAGGLSRFPAIYLQNFNSSLTQGGVPLISLLNSRGTSSAPLALTANQRLGILNFGGGDGVATGSTTVKIEGDATETYSTTAHGSRLLFSTTSNGTTTVTERMRIDQSGNVGIGTTAPAYKLDVAGDINTNGALRINGTAISASGSNLWTQGVPGSYYSGTGNVGIGTTSPGYALSVVGDTNTTGFFRSNNSAVLRAFGNNTQLWAGSGNNILFNTNGSSTSSMWIDSSGSVGIGTTAPTAALQVNGQITSSAGVYTNGFVTSSISQATPYAPTGSTFVPASGGYLKANNPSSTDGAFSQFYFSTTNANTNPQSAYIGAFSNSGGGVYTPSIVIGQQTASTGYAERLRIDQNGNVGIGTTAPGYKVDVAGQVNATAFSIGGVPLSSGGANAWALNGTNISNTNTGNVGIGTDVPYSKLHVVASSGGAPLLGSSTLLLQDDTFSTSSANIYMAGGASGTQMLGFGTRAGQPGSIKYQSANDVMAFGTNSNERMRIDASGNVGIGTTTPLAALNIATTSATDALRIATSGGGLLRYDQYGILTTDNGIRSTTGNGNFQPMLSAGNGYNRLLIGSNVNYNAGSSQYDVTTNALYDRAAIEFQNGGNIGFISDAGDRSGAPLLSPATWSGLTKMVIRPSGNVGIGTTTPAYKLDVAGDINTNGALRINGTAISASGSNLWTQAGSGSYYSGTGNVGIGTTTPGYPLSIVGGIGFSRETNPAADLAVIRYLNQSTGLVIKNASATDPITFQTSSAERVRIDSSGNVGIGTTTPGALLDVNGTVNANTLTFGTSSGASLNGFIWAGSVSGQFEVYNNASLNSAYTTIAGGKGAGTHLELVSGLGGGVSNDYVSIKTSNAQTERLRVDTSGKVGIGTTAPVNLLDIAAGGGVHLGDGAPSSTTAALYNTGGTLYWNGVAVSSGGAAGIGGSGTTNYLPAFTGASTLGNSPLAMSGSSIGLGTASPDALLHLKPTTVAGGKSVALALQNPGNTANSEVTIDFNATNNAFGNRSAQIGAATTGTNGTSILFRTNAPGAAGVEHVRIDPYGNFGIGTASPAKTLDVAGTFQASGNSAINSTTASTYWGDGALTVAGGLGLAGQLNANGNVVAPGMIVQNAGASVTPSYVASAYSTSGVGQMVFQRYRGTTFASPLAVVDGDAIGRIQASGYNGTTVPDAADIILSVDGTNVTGSGNYTGGRIDFQTRGSTYTGQGGGLTAMTIRNSGNVGIGTTAPAYKLDVAGAVNATSLLVNGVAVGTGGSSPWVTNGTTIYNSNSGNVGIGTTSPGFKLDVAGSANAYSYMAGYGTVSTPSYGNGSTAGMWFPAYNIAALSTNGSERLRIDGSGNVGIGTTSPSTMLYVAGTSQLVGNVGIGGAPGTNPLTVTGSASLTNSQGGYGLFQYAGSSTFVYSLTQSNIPSAYSVVLSSAGGIGLAANQTGNASGAASNLWVATSGNVGIGTTLPGYKLDVAGAVNATSLLINGVAVGAGGSSPWVSSGSNIYQADVTQNVGVGTASPLDKLQVGDYVNSNNNYIRMGTNGGGSFEDGLKLRTLNDFYGFDVVSSDLSPAGFHIRSHNASSTAVDNLFIARSSGFVGIGTTAPAYALDTVGTVNASTGIRSPSIFVNGIGNLTAAGSVMTMATVSTSQDIAFSPNYVEKMRVTAAGNVGIGTTAPAYRLDVAGDINTNGALRINGTAISASGSNLWTQSGSGSYYAGTGNVGIGTTSPGTALEVNGQIAANVGSNSAPGLTFAGYPSAGLSLSSGANLVISTSGFPSRLTIGSSSMWGNGNYSPLMAIGGSANLPSNPAYGFLSDAGNGMYRPAASSVAFSTASTERVRIDSSGNVGIGTTAPGAALQVVGTTSPIGWFRTTGATDSKFYIDNISGGNQALFGLQDAGVTKWQIGKSANNGFFIYDSVNARNILTTNGSGDLSLMAAGGNVGIGTTAPSSALEVAGTLTAAYATVTNTLSTNTVSASSVAAGKFLISNVVGTAPSNGIFTPSTGAIGISTNSGGERMRIDSSGNVGIGTTAPAYKLDVAGDIRIASTSKLYVGTTATCDSTGCTASPSDARYKTNVLPLQGSLEQILKLQGVGYDWIDQKQFNDKHQIGFIAQDLEKVYPEVVKTDSTTGFKSVMYDKLVAPLVEAVKAMYARVTAVETRVAGHDREIASVVADNAKLKSDNQKLAADAAAKAARIETLEQQNAETKARLDKIEKMLLERSAQ